VRVSITTPCEQQGASTCLRALLYIPVSDPFLHRFLLQTSTTRPSLSRWHRDLCCARIQPSLHTQVHGVPRNLHTHGCLWTRSWLPDMQSGGAPWCWSGDDTAAGESYVYAMVIPFNPIGNPGYDTCSIADEVIGSWFANLLILLRWLTIC